ncbi:50S ribosomal protein L15 [Roseovarius salinarum]|uniref:50S ribosomal protein L15 n=1 Tax=Roseovarius salinarum TaxID=1981892 RepID=UPI000C33B7B4|nr:50S ribosomal protein L15 [Roseovarius salinarum]
MKLNELRDNAGATRSRKRVGRGPGSGIGKTGGRGLKGQKSRSGVAVKGFEGGQMPIYQRLPKRGFNKPNAKRYAVVNLGLIQKFVDAGKIDAKQPITEDVLVASGLVRRKRDGIRVLAKGEVTAKLALEVTGASKAAVAAVDQAGGSLTVTTPQAAE